MTSPGRKRHQEPYMQRLELAKAYIRNVWAVRKTDPSINEIARNFKTSNFVVSRWIQDLRELGWLEPIPADGHFTIVPAEIFRDRPVFPN